MSHVAFLRNLNQGQRNSPTTGMIIEAFRRGGATDARTFQTNGTVVFTAAQPDDCAGAAARLLIAESPWNDVVFVRSLEWTAALTASVELAANVDPRRGEVSLFDESISIAGLVPILGRRCQVVSGGSGFAVTVNEKSNESNATPTIERAVEQPVTSRGLPTLQRLIQQFS